LYTDIATRREISRDRDFMKSGKNNRLLISKIVYTLVIVFIFLLGKEIPLYRIDVLAYMDKAIDADTILVQTIGADMNRCSLFALGISPYMVASIFVQVLYLFRGREIRKKTSPVKMNKLIMKIMLLLAVIMALVRVKELHFCVVGNSLIFARIIAVLEMITGAMVILYLSVRNKKYGIGGQSMLIFVNVIDGILESLRKQDVEQLQIPIIMSLVILLVVMVMENAEKRIPVQRISIHNIYGDKNYLAIKLNPIGVMPAMFSTAVFMIPQLLVSVARWCFPDDANIGWLKDHLVLTEPFGIVVYALILYIMTIGFSRIMLSPDELTEHFLKNGDSLCDIHAGKDTKKYLSRVITRISFFSATVMSICLCGPLVLYLTGNIESSFLALSTSVMMLAGLGNNMYDEVAAIRNLDAYHSFIL